MFKACIEAREDAKKQLKTLRETIKMRREKMRKSVNIGKDIGTLIHDEAQEYESRDPDYSPNDHEKSLLEDFGNHLILVLEDEGWEINPPPTEEKFTVSRKEMLKFRELLKNNFDLKDKSYHFMFSKGNGIGTTVKVVFDDNSIYDITDYTSW